MQVRLRWWGGGRSSSFVAIIVRGHGRQWRVVFWSVVSWLSVVLAVRGWVVVVHGHSIFMSAGSWSSMGGSSTAAQHGWVVVVCGWVIHVVCRLWVVMVVLGGSHSSVCKWWQSFVGGCGRVWWALDHPRVGGRCPWVLVVNGGVVVGNGGAVVVVVRCAKGHRQHGMHALCACHVSRCGGAICWAPPLS